MSENVAVQDPLSNLLRKLNFSASVFFRAEYCGQWAVDTSGTQQIPFHLVAQGEGWLHSGDQPPRRLVEGHLVLFPHDSPHLLAATDQPPDPGTVNSGPPERMQGPTTRLVCGYYTFDRQAAWPMLSSLPSTMVLDLGGASTATARQLVQLWMREAADQSFGSDIAVDRLAELVFIEMLRTEISTDRMSGLIGALSDDRLGSILARIHRDPGASHSLEEMALAANLSESAFAQRFKKQVGMTPGHYVRHWRMQIAAKALRATNRPMADIAASIGYDSEVAFRKAFRAHFETSPGRYRRL